MTALPLADWLILAALAIVIALSRLWAQRHPKVLVPQDDGEDGRVVDPGE